MAARKTNTNLYDVLQVPPHASAEDISAAYERLHALYSPEHLAGGPPEFEELARQKRADLTDAYHVLADPAQRAQYNQQIDQAAVEPQVLDYTPLPPARGQERTLTSAIDMGDQAPRTIRPASAQRWLPAALVAVGGLAFLLLLIFSSVRVDASPTALATPTIAGVQVPFTENQIEQFRSAAEASDTAQTWQAYGNALFNNLQTLRENAPQSPQYQGIMDQWLEVARAYERSLSLEENEIVRADYAFSLLAYSTVTNDESSRQQAIAEAEQAVERGVNEPRALINYGLILVEADPPRVEEAATLWRKVLESAPDSSEAVRAEVLLQSYGQQDDT